MTSVAIPRRALMPFAATAAILLIAAVFALLVMPDLAAASLTKVGQNTNKEGTSAARNVGIVIVVVIAIMALLTRSPQKVLIALVVTMIAGALIYNPEDLMKSGGNLITKIVGS